MKKKKLKLKKISHPRIQNLNAIKGGERRKTSTSKLKVD